MMDRFLSQIVLVILSMVSGMALAQSANSNVKAIYELPASATQSEHTYPLTNMVITKDSAGLQTLSFSLPLDLVGPGFPPIVLKQGSPANGAQWTMDGELASAACSMADNGVSCKMSYGAPYNKTLGINEPALQDYLERTYGANSSLLSQKMNEATLFRNDPEGVIIF